MVHGILIAMWTFPMHSMSNCKKRKGKKEANLYVIYS